MPHDIAPPDLTFLVGGGEMGARIRAFDWSQTSLGPIQTWPQSLRTMVSMVINSKFPSYLLWGPDLVGIYNDAYRPLAGGKPELLGVPFREAWAEVWDDITPIVDKALAGEASYFEDLLLPVNRYGEPEEAYFTFCYSPVRDESGRVAGLLDTVTETSQKVRTERALRESQDRLRQLNETLEARVAERTRERDRIWRLSGDLMDVCNAKGDLLAVNAAWTRVLGWTKDELLQLNFLDLVHPDDVGSTLRELAKLDRGVTTLNFENRFRCKDGEHRLISWTASPEGGLFYAIGRDITGQRQTEEALHQAQKMEAVGQLTGGIAHDFNNLLTGILGAIEMLQTRVRQGRLNDIERYTTAASNAAHRAAALTHRLLAFSRRQPLDPKPVDANQLVTSMEDLLRRTSGETIRIETMTAAGLWTTLCDPNQLESAILNLAINARDAMPDGGTLTIETCNVDIDARYAQRLGEVAPGQYICVCVSDTGVGMAKETIDKAFEPFFTTKPIGQGTGLGLSMVYGFARQSDGFVRIDSEVDRGSTVKIYLPRDHGLPDNQDMPQLEPPQRGQGEVVLVVEDEPTVRDLVSEILRDLGYHVMEAHDGPAGLKILNSNVRIDVMVSDVGLPGLNGRQLADAARHHRPALKVLFMTGYAENAAIAGGFLEPGMEMITKPFAVEAFAARIRGLVGQA
ncbi:response regulator [Microvirga sp. M2]|uniref:hybrid sensor histidine kinase/response regulator n=1 Tax=Microvirga sp. M2 TaxID=3073270 RepID=UPI0039C496B5